MHYCRIIHETDRITGCVGDHVRNAEANPDLRRRAYMDSFHNSLVSIYQLSRACFLLCGSWPGLSRSVYLCYVEIAENTEVSQPTQRL